MNHGIHKFYDHSSSGSGDGYEGLRIFLYRKRHSKIPENLRAGIPTLDSYFERLSPSVSRSSFIRNLTQRRNSQKPKRMQKYLIVLIFVLVANLLATNCAPINSEEDPENLQDLDQMYTCHKEPKKSCKTTDRIKCHRKRILHHVYKLCAKIPVEECHIKHETVCFRKKSISDFHYEFRQYSG